MFSRMFAMVVERLFIPDVQKVSGVDKKICALGITKMLTELPQMSPGGEYSHLW